MATTIRVVMPGKGSVDIHPTRDLIASGGEGSVYKKGTDIVKLWHDPAFFRKSGIDQKIKLLSAISHPSIIAPIDIVQNSQHETVGYYMSKAPGDSLVKVFSNNIWQQSGFCITDATTLVSNMKSVVETAHGAGALLVDGNEMNWLYQKTTPYVIDVDSWEIGPYKATALMPSIRDWHTAGFDVNTDWFSWGIVTFQIFSGIHPYKGSHPDFKRGDLEQRMKANASVFDTRTKLNAAVRDLSEIPGGLLAWYEDLFQHGARSAPPNNFMGIIPANSGHTKAFKTVRAGSTSVTHELQRIFPGTIRHVSSNGVVVYMDGFTLKAYDFVNKSELTGLTSVEIESLFTNQAVLLRYLKGLMLLSVTNNKIEGRHIQTSNSPTPKVMSTSVLALEADRLLIIQNKAYAVNNVAMRGLTGLNIVMVGDRPVLAVDPAWPVLTQATRFYNGVGVMDGLGAKFIVVPEGLATHINLCPELAQYAVIDAYARSSNFVMLLALQVKTGEVHRLILYLEKAEYRIVSSTITDATSLNFAINEGGIGVGIFDDEHISVFNTKGAGTKIVQDSTSLTNLNLVAIGTNMLYYSGSDLYRVTLSNK